MALDVIQPIWYAAYGSNCSAARLNAYLAGSRASNSAAIESGARDPSPPTASAPCEIPHRVRFAGKSSKWGGAVAFLEHQPSRPPSLGRRYLITRGQFYDLIAQESRRDSVVLPINRLVAGVHLKVGDGPYDSLLALDPVAGVAVVTFTSPSPPELRQPAAPSRSYLATIVCGLAEVHDLSADAIAERLLLSPGVAPHWTKAAISDLGTPEE